jgi:hypothetical protein
LHAKKKINIMVDDITKICKKKEKLNTTISDDNNVPPSPSGSVPLTTEEPVRRPWLRSELDNINKDDTTEEEAPNTTRTDESGSSDDDDEEDSLTGQNKIKNITESPDSADEERQKEYQGLDIMACLSREMSDYQDRQQDETELYEKKVSDAATEEDLLGVVDPELLRRTESNRRIPYDEAVSSTRKKRSNTIHGQSDDVHRNLLVFSDNPTVIETVTEYCVVQHYGAGISGVMPMAYQRKKKPKAYLVASDFSKESLYAIEWTMGTMMRDGDELHIATVANREDNPEAVKATGLDQAGEVYICIACNFSCSQS